MLSLSKHVPTSSQRSRRRVAPATRIGTGMNQVPEPQLDDLYRELILDHYRHPHTRGSLEHATARNEGFNPLCGDEVAVDIEIENGLIKDVAFRGRGCSISQASSSMMTDAVKGHSP